MAGPVLVYYCSGHGYGHATRVSALSTHLLSLPATHKPNVYIVSSAPKHVFADSIALGGLYRYAEIDPVIVQPLAYQVDRRKSVEALKLFLQRKEALLEKETHWLREIQAHGVLSDAAFLGCLAAKGAGIPSVLVTNFTFDSVYSYLGTTLLEGAHNTVDDCASVALEDHPISQAELEPLVAEIIAGYRCADLLLCLPGCIPIPSFSSSPDLPAPNWIDPSTNTFSRPIINHILTLRTGSPLEIYPALSATLRPRTVIPAPLLVRPPSAAAVYTSFGRTQFLSSIGIPSHLHDRKILIVSFGGQIIHCPKTSVDSHPSKQSACSLDATISAVHLSEAENEENTIVHLSSTPFSSEHLPPSRIGTPSHLWVPGAPAPVRKPTPAPTPFSSPVVNTPKFSALISPLGSPSLDATASTPTFSTFAIPPTSQLGTKASVESSEDGRRLLPDDSWIAVICGVSKEQWAKEGRDDELPEQFFIAPKDVYMPDLTAVADVLLGKLGYGTVSECIDACTPFVYVSRPLFIEEHGLRLLLEEEGTGVELSRAAYEMGDWAGAVSDAWTRGGAAKALKHALESNGGPATRAGAKKRILPHSQTQEQTRRMARSVVEWFSGSGVGVFEESRVQ